MGNNDILNVAAVRGLSKYEAYSQKFPDTKQRVFEYIKDFDNVSFAELNRLIGEEAHKGDYGLPINNDCNIVYWAGMCEEYSRAVLELVNEGKIFYEPCGTYVGGLPLVYMTDGCLLNFPIAKRLINYKKTRWLPVCLTTRKKLKR